MNRQRSDAAKAPHAAGSLGWWLTVTIVTALVAGYAWSHPTTETTDVPATYTSTYHFSYDGDIPAGSGVYNGDTMRFGDPVYLKVLDRIDVAVDFSFLAASLDITSDNSQLTTQVLLSSDAGWSRLLVDEHLPFEGTAATARIGVDFAQAQRVAAELADTTGVTGAVQVAVVVGVTSDLTIAGRISGGPLRHDVSAATLVFDLVVTAGVALDADDRRRRPFEPSPDAPRDEPAHARRRCAAVPADLGAAVPPCAGRHPAAAARPDAAPGTNFQMKSGCSLESTGAGSYQKVIGRRPDDRRQS